MYYWCELHCILANYNSFYSDDIAIAQAINEIEAELNEDETAHRTSIFDADGVDVDLNEIDADLQQISSKEIDFKNQGKKDITSAEGDHTVRSLQQHPLIVVFAP